MACEKPANEVRHWIGRELGFRRCIGAYFSMEAMQWVKLHAQFEKGILPYPGSLMDQPAKAIEAFNLISTMKIERDEKIQRQQANQSPSGKRLNAR